MQHKHGAEQQKRSQPTQLGDGKIKCAARDKTKRIEKVNLFLKLINLVIGISLLGPSWPNPKQLTS